MNKINVDVLTSGVFRFITANNDIVQPSIHSIIDLADFKGDDNWSIEYHTSNGSGFLTAKYDSEIDVLTMPITRLSILDECELDHIHGVDQKFGLPLNEEAFNDILKDIGRLVEIVTAIEAIALGGESRRYTYP